MDTTAIMNEIQDCYQNYPGFCREIIRKATPGAGIFGFGNGPKTHPGHEEFYNRVGTLVQKFLSMSPSEEQVCSLTALVLFSADENRSETLAYWFLYAAQGHARQLIPLLPQGEAASLLQRYDRVYPKRDRYPVQEEVYRLLKRQAKAKR